VRVRVRVRVRAQTRGGPPPTFTVSKFVLC